MKASDCTDYRVYRTAWPMLVGAFSLVLLVCSVWCSVRCLYCHTGVNLSMPVSGSLAVHIATRCIQSSQIRAAEWTCRCCIVISAVCRSAEVAIKASIRHKA